MSKPYKGFEPDWYRGEVPESSYRSIFKWGDPERIKAPKETLYNLMKEKFGVTDEDFREYRENLGLDEVRFNIPVRLPITLTPRAARKSAFSRLRKYGFMMSISASFTVVFVSCRICRA